ncbi:Protein bicaudal D, partial [Fragariocoptes setiger]
MSNTSNTSPPGNTGGSTPRDYSDSGVVLTQTDDKTNLFTASADALRLEVDRLNRELAQALHERSQSAAFGLELLNQKEHLQQKYDSLEASYEQTKLDLHELREAWNKSLNEQKLSATTGIEQEERLLSESAAREATLSTTIQEIERELKHTRNQLASLEIEKDRYVHERDELCKNIEILEIERKNYKSELRELKSRETRLLTENNELEEENVNLQKQISALRISQVEFESSKHEIQRLRDEMDALNSELEEAISVKRITEGKMQEAFEALQSEREQKYAIKKELDRRCNSESIANWSSLAALKGSSHFNISDVIGHGNQKSKRNHQGSPLRPGDYDSGAGIGSSMDADTTSNMMQELDMPSLEGSLFDEVHLTEIKKLQKTLEENENQSSQLNAKIIELQHKLDAKIRESESLEKMIGAICKLVHDSRKMAEQPDFLATRNQVGHVATIGEDKDNEAKEKLYGELDVMFSYLTDILSDLKSHHQMSSVFLNAKENEGRIKQVESDILKSLEIFESYQKLVGSAHDDLLNVSEELALIYHHVCHVNGQQPNRVMLQHVQSSQEALNEQDLSSLSEKDSLLTQYNLIRKKYTSTTKSIDVASHESTQDTETSNSGLKSHELNKLIETVRDQLKNLRDVLEKHTPQPSIAGVSDPSDSTEVSEDLASVQKLKSLLSTKREQIAVLRNVLKTNKQTAEVALANLKSKYETEKAVVTETMTKLRHELKGLKEDAATFASLRSMFSARCEEFSTQIDELQSKLAASEQEKSTLNSILRMAIEQKVVLTQKLESLEMDREGSQFGMSTNSGPKDSSSLLSSFNPRTINRRSSTGRGLRHSRSMRVGSRRVPQI